MPGLLFEQTHMAEQSHLGEMAVETRLEVKADYVFTFKQLQMHHIGVTEVAPLAHAALRHHALKETDRTPFQTHGARGQVLFRGEEAPHRHSREAV